MKKIILLLYITIIPFKSCQEKIENSKTQVDKPDWWLQKNNDTLPSINFEEAYHYIRDKKLKHYSTTVAMLDTDIDLPNTDFQKVLWKNPKEESNNKDDDNNNYIDDIYGWNFLGTKKDGKGLPFTLMEETRILRKYSKGELDSLFQEKKINFNYQQVKSSFDTIVSHLTNDIEYYRSIEKGYSFVLDTIGKIEKNPEITLDQLKNIDVKDAFLKQWVDYIIGLNDQGYTYKSIKNDLEFKKNSLDICMNLNYDNRVLVGDDLCDLENINYGSSILTQNSPFLLHGTKIAGILAKYVTKFQELNQTNNSDNLKILPICISGVGNFTDKDMSLAIRYAVDNGAKVINISQGKSFSIHEVWIDDAVRYAEEKDVLIIKSAGNSNKDNDTVLEYPNDSDLSGTEFVTNFLVIGGSTKNFNKNIKLSYSNYGKKNVDLFAPAEDICTILPDGIYMPSEGTSYAAAIISSIAALIRSYFPKLSAKQVKQILMDSGTSYAIEVEIKREDGTKKLVPFSELSKSGKVVNAYNALLLAEKVSKGKKGN